LTRHALSREFCRRVGWYKADGGLKDMMARVAMLAMHRDGRIELPPPQGPPSRRKPIVFGPLTEPPLLPPPDTLDAVRPLSLRTVVRGTREGRLWNEFVARYHYLGYTTLVGAQMRYAVHARDNRPLAMLGFSTAAWTLAPRDRFIGWSRQLREKNLPLVIDNPRFLILPWVHIPNLGSHILALVRRQLPRDWTARDPDPGIRRTRLSRDPGKRVRHQASRASGPEGRASEVTVVTEDHDPSRLPPAGGDDLRRSRAGPRPSTESRPRGGPRRGPVNRIGVRKANGVIGLRL
ncbi:MAG: DUF4338 domain-containing protein, partial [Acidobacteriota bacterium]|nr:DUF4338 domain-containing protein [Acidobacteriota bacterium]